MKYMVISKKVGVILLESLILCKSWTLANYCFFISSIPIVQGLPGIESTQRFLTKNGFLGSSYLSNRDFENRKTILIQIARETEARFKDMPDERVAQILRFDGVTHQDINGEFYLWSSVNSSIPLSSMNQIQRQNTLNVSMVNYKEANKLCKTGTCFLLGTFILGSYSMVEVAWLRRFSTILGVGELFLGIELGQRVHPEAPFGLFSNPISGKICELKLFSPYKTGIIRFGWNRIRDALTTTILIVFCGAPLQLLGHELPNDSGTSCVGDVVSGIRRVFQSVFQAVYEKTAWVVPTSTEKYFTQFRNFRNGYIEEIMFEDPTIQNEQIIERLRQICLQNTQGQIDNIFIGKQYFCSYDNLYDESKCTELYARLEI